MKEILSTVEVHEILMRKLIDIGMHLPEKQCKKILHIVSQLDNLRYDPTTIRTEEDCKDEEECVTIYSLLKRGRKYSKNS